VQAEGKVTGQVQFIELIRGSDVSELCNRQHNHNTHTAQSRLLVLCVSWLPQKYSLLPRFLSHLTHSALTDAVSLYVVSAYRYAQFGTGVAVSLNSNDAQVYSRVGSQWNLSETLSEVR
jgi:hypothetical protein